jgi:tRNA dimethylallyltransferase
MMQEGLLKEVKRLIPYRYLNALNTVGYTELFDHLYGKTDLDTAVALIKQNTRRFAKRQLTWFKRDRDTQWFHPTDIPAMINYVNEQISRSNA